jgi:GxxExxY protein
LELAHRNIRFSNEVWLPIVYRGTSLDNAYRMDLIVEDWLIVEVKAIEKVSFPVHRAQALDLHSVSHARDKDYCSTSTSRA